MSDFFLEMVNVDLFSPAHSYYSQIPKRRHKFLQGLIGLLSVTGVFMSSFLIFDFEDGPFGFERVPS